MKNYEVTVLAPGIRDLGAAAKASWKSQFAADVYIEPPVNVGGELGRFIGGVAGNILVLEIASTQDGTHVTVA